MMKMKLNNQSIPSKEELIKCIENDVEETERII